MIVTVFPSLWSNCTLLFDVCACLRETTWVEGGAASDDGGGGGSGCVMVEVVMVVEIVVVAV